MITQCCQCKKYRVEGQWITPNDYFHDSGQISHSYCPQCAEQATLEFVNYRIDSSQDIDYRYLDDESI